MTRCYLPPGVPLPEPTSWERPFWAHCAERRLMFQRCADCGAVRHPPMPVCPECRSLNDDWIHATDDAALYTFTVIHHANHDALRDAVPYNAAVVIFPALQNVRLVTNIVDAAPNDLRIGMPLDLVWEEPAQGRVLPRFRPRRTAKGR